MTIDLHVMHVVCGKEGKILIMDDGKLDFADASNPILKTESYLRFECIRWRPLPTNN